MLTNDECLQRAIECVERASGVKSSTSFSVTPCRSKGAGLVGNGCVADDRSPGIVDCGTGRSSIDQIGSPDTRSRT